MATVEELEEQLAKRRAARAELETEQRAKDLGAQIELEEEHDALAVVKVAKFVPGQPTMALVKTPTPAAYKRYVDTVGRAVDKKTTSLQREAQEQLARSSWVYPAEDEARKSMLATFPGLLTSIGLAASALAEGRAEAEGKG